MRPGLHKTKMATPILHSVLKASSQSGYRGDLIAYSEVNIQDCQCFAVGNSFPKNLLIHKL